MSDVREHATLGGSSSKRWMNCPGSVRMSASFPDAASKYAEEGTLAHGLGEHVVGTRVLGLDGEDTTFAFVGQEISTDGVTGVVTEDMAAAVDVFVRTVEDYYRAYAADHADVRIALEERFDLSPLGPPAPMFGTADVTIWAGDTLHQIDYKHGQGVVVEVEENPQLMYYALGASVSAGRVPEKVVVTIVQPRAPHPEGPVRSYTFDRTRLIEFKHELFEAAARTLEEDAPLSVGEWCRFCRAAAVCPAKKAQAESVALTVFADDLVRETDPPAPATLTDDEIALVLQQGGDVMQWIRDVEAYALARMEEGHEIPGFKLVRGRAGNRRWVDEERASRALARRGLRVDDRYEKKLISPAAAERALRARGQDDKVLEKHWEKPDGKIKIAPTDDPRPALPPAVERVFGPAEDPATVNIETSVNE